MFHLSHRVLFALMLILGMATLYCSTRMMQAAPEPMFRPVFQPRNLETPHFAPVNPSFAHPNVGFRYAPQPSGVIQSNLTHFSYLGHNSYPPAPNYRSPNWRIIPGVNNFNNAPQQMMPNSLQMTLMQYKNFVNTAWLSNYQMLNPGFNPDNIFTPPYFGPTFNPIGFNQFNNPGLNPFNFNPIGFNQFNNPGFPVLPQVGFNFNPFVNNPFNNPGLNAFNSNPFANNLNLAMNPLAVASSLTALMYPSLNPMGNPGMGLKNVLIMPGMNNNWPVYGNTPITANHKGVMGFTGGYGL